MNLFTLGGSEGLQVGQSYGPINAEFHLPPETPPRVFAIPFSRDPDFVNCGDILDQVDRRCSEPAARVALVGLGGVGKSQLVIEYAHLESQPGRPDTFDIPLLVYDWLSNEQNGRWIMILDSADDHGVFYSPTSNDDPASGDAHNGRPFATYLPQELTGRTQNIIEVGPMTQTDALALLEKKLGSLPDTDVAADLVWALDLIPLAISQAAAYIQARAPRSSPEKYLAEFRESERKRSRLLEHDAGDLRREVGASNAILSTWQISFDHIRSKRPSAADLLSLMSFFDRQGIPRWVLNLSSGIDDSADDDIDSTFEDDVAMLNDYCLIVADGVGDQFEMHGIVQLSTRRWLESFGQQETFKQQYIERMAASFPTGEYENWVTCGSLFAHVQVVLEYQPSEDTVEIWATLLHNGGWYAWSQGRYEVAQQMLGKARRVREKRLGAADVTTLATISMVARVLLDRGRWEDAEKLFVQVMEIRKTKLGVDHPSTLTSMGNLASTYRNQARWKEAEKLEVKVMEIRKTKLGADHPDTLTSMNDLALTYQSQGRWEEAEKLFVQVMEARKTKLGADHPDTLTSMNDLALTYQSQGRWEEAEKLFVQVMEIRKTKLGADHPDTLTSMNNLALTCESQGRWEEAEKLFVQVMEIRKTKLGADHPSTLTSMGNLASTYRNQGRWKEAEKLEVQVMEIRKTKLGADHPDTLTSMNSLALTYWNQGRWEEAEKLFVLVMEARKIKLGADHPDTLTSMNNLALTYESQGRWEEAEKLEVQVMEIRKTKLRADHPSTLTSMGNLASTQGRWEEAEKLEVQLGVAPSVRSRGETSSQLDSMAPRTYVSDSGYVSGTAGTSKSRERPQLQATIHEEAGMIAEGSNKSASSSKNPQNQEASASIAKTEYSLALSVLPERVGQYLSEMARLLKGAMPPGPLDDSTLQGLEQELPGMLKTFALKMGDSGSTPEDREIMYFVYKHRE
ncbi:hypothetical protein GE09DRAFT_1179411 [Coniochaeta sp. 2T2.1]|nr:hypothetical protein GE09DRAFT_1179411 [Coniochaeta sp. 2T2.1]